MLPNVAPIISIAFLFITLVTLLLFLRILKASQLEATRANTKRMGFFLLLWLVLQGVLSYIGIYKNNTEALPPKIMLLGILPVVLFFIYLFTSKKGKLFLDNLPLLALTYLHIIRIPVELVLYALFYYNAVPKIMTFEAYNFDILAGISAIFVVYFGIYQKRMGHLALLIWNFISLALLINIVILALLSAPSPLQMLAFNQANIAVLYFPFIYLPTFVVPIVFLCHTAAIRQLLKFKTITQ
jgi:hypothetical protein